MPVWFRRRPRVSAATLLAAALTLVGLPGPAYAFQSPDRVDAPGSADHVLSRIVVIGASVSHGFGLHVNLADALHASIAVPHDRPLDGTLGDFFNASLDVRSDIVKRADARDPTAVVAVDFLFWYVNSSRSPEVQRKRLAEGLSALDTFSCPVVTSLLPDMSTAPGFLFAAKAMPRGRALAELNATIAEWATVRPNVILVPLPVTLERIRHGRALRVGDWVWKPGSSARFLQPDGTHPTEMGLVLIACLVNHALMTRISALGSDAFMSDKDEILETLQAIRRVRAMTADANR